MSYDFDIWEENRKLKEKIRMQSDMIKIFWIFFSAILIVCLILFLFMIGYFEFTRVA